MTDKKTEDFLIRDRRVEWPLQKPLLRRDVFLDKKCLGVPHYHGQSSENFSFSLMLALVIYSN